MTERLTGAYGFVIQPDKETQMAAVALTNRLAPNAEFQTESPHVTLYHAKFDRLPVEEARKILDNLEIYKGTSLILNRLQVFGDKFIFWDIYKTKELVAMHHMALESSSYLDKKAAAKAIEEGLNLTQKEQDNIAKFGHPLVLENYLPHITLAYDGKGLNLPKRMISQTQEMKIEAVLFCEMGKYGSVKYVYPLHG